MSKLTTGELAKQAHVSVRTLQYYDKRGLLRPTEVSEGGRRLYTVADLQRLKLILLLKGMDLSLAAIQEILDSAQSTRVLALLLDQQEQRLRAEQVANAAKLKTVVQVRDSLADFATVPIQSIEDMERIMDNKKGLRRIHVNMVVWGLLMDVIELVALIYSIVVGNWWVFGAAMVVAIIFAAVTVRHYFKAVDYICPACSSQFRPSFKQAFWAGHTPKTRKLTCPVCGQTNYCVEVLGKTAPQD
ncbi:MerR family transcriptional regulator [Levilactobacillus hammesii]|uniref:Transcriptional regulator n=1 Tax=Levilactobacillus hammesii DSM 16381 TaxID=1423753 RepID=A0A0R1UUI9_9LACO|nr:MerR family transcriptional regulator [Levilactobacillus hammesii]KRL93707.1 transcriptional regulator [Levilactobacillus hammesii DSM 16381]